MDDRSDESNERFPGIEQLAEVPDPPPDTKQRILSELRQKGRIRSRQAPLIRERRVPAVYVALLFVLALGLGFVLRPFTEDLRAGRSEGTPYLLLLRTGGAVEISPQENDRRVQEYASWAGDLARRNQLLSAEKLDSSGLELSGSEEHGLPAASPEQVEGFFLIQAADLQAAAAIAQSCPHLRYGGTIEVRPIS